ncbi:HAD hydrolase family protein [Gardnerella vaginalis]|uniref:Eukaryotic phosphomannomutase n=1 Tax=Gardnerella vaginalis TaxID=2702 RepID=A0A133NZ01_GARVA|nr:HAD hydrolase family protein [Gardnerella vaginalis]EPI43656.1 eukaryotic phosphomannomutase [Gardnerella vaginalis JCP8481A]EPI44641.1 eukaryotic phosphomannomutase [Gardnerella vaginalis JCP8481B]KXA21482.1 eukaryotic phosphomannomutase [Gardnerella vaginalis]
MLKPIIHDWNECALDLRIAQSSLIGFDLDNTLACSRKPMLLPMAESLSNLMNELPVAIITGGCLSLVQSQILDMLLPGTQLNHLHIMPTNGTSYYRIDSHKMLHCVYEHRINAEQTRCVIAAIQQCAKHMGVWKESGDPMLWGNQIEHRGSQITFSALGQLAPIEYKKAWDPTGVLKAKLAQSIALALPEFAVRAGGDTSVDVYRRGDDKAQALRMLAQYGDFAIERITFIGDRMTPGGNDYPTAFTGALAVHVTSPTDTLKLCNNVLTHFHK